MEELTLKKKTLLVFTHLRRMDSSASTLLTGLFPKADCLVSFYYSRFIEISVFNPDQMQRSVVSYLGLHYLSVTFIVGGVQTKMG